MGLKAIDEIKSRTKEMRIIKQIANLFITLLLMVATTGVTLHKHYCLGELKNISLFQEAETCMAGMNMEQESCPMDCCDTTAEQLILDDFKQVTFEKSYKPDLKLVAVMAFVLVDYQLNGITTTQPSYQNYKPPLIDQDIPVMVQSFLL